jgi:hypothetical protein
VLLHNPATEVLILRHNNLAVEQESPSEMCHLAERGEGAFRFLRSCWATSAMGSSSSGLVANAFQTSCRRGISGQSTTIPSMA